MNDLPERQDVNYMMCAYTNVNRLYSFSIDVVD